MTLIGYQNFCVKSHNPFGKYILPTVSYTHLHYVTCRIVCWKPWMLSSLFSEHTVENIEKLEFFCLLPTCASSRFLNRRTCIGGTVAVSQVTGYVKPWPFPSLFWVKDVRGFLMSHIRIFSFCPQMQAFLLSSICQPKKCTNSWLSQFPAELIRSDVIFRFGVKTYLSPPESLWGNVPRGKKGILRGTVESSVLMGIVMLCDLKSTVTFPNICLLISKR